MLIVSICFGVLFAAANAVADPPRYRVIVVDLPQDVPEPTSVSTRMGISNRGEAVSTYQYAPLGGEGHYPFIWMPTANVNYDPDLELVPGSNLLPFPEEGQDFVARDVNIHGIVVGKATEVEDYVEASWFWDLAAGTSGAIQISNQGVDAWKEEAFAVNNADPAVVVGQSWFFADEQNPTDLDYGYRKVLGDGHDLLDFYFTSHVYAWPLAVADNGFAVGQSQVDFPTCGAQQTVFRAVTWPAGGTSPITPANLVTLGTSQAEAFTLPLGVNNASPNMIVGHGRDPNDPLPGGDCRQRALFWSAPSASPTTLPFLTINGQPFTQDNMRADAISDPDNNGVIRVVGRSAQQDVAVLWRRVNNVWEAIDLNEVPLCGGDLWDNLASAVDINSCGWIVGFGQITNDSWRAFVAIPYEGCPGDICGDVDYPNGKVDIDDLLKIVSQWGASTCAFDITGDSTINIDDLLAVINNWGPCDCWPEQATVQSFSQLLAAANLTMSDWNAFTNVMATGSESDKNNYNCWMQRYLTGCARCPSCPGNDPFD